MSFRAAMIQFDTAYMDVGENISRMSALIDEAASPSSPPDLIVMPELWTSGYSEEIFRISGGLHSRPMEKRSPCCGKRPGGTACGSPEARWLSWPKMEFTIPAS